MTFGVAISTRIGGSNSSPTALEPPQISPNVKPPAIASASATA